MLVAMDSVGAKEGSDGIFFSWSGDVESVAKLFCKFLPFAEGGSTVDSSIVILFVRDGDHISILIGHSVSSDQEGPEVQFDGLLWVSAFFGGNGSKIYLQGLSYFLVEGHGHGDGVGFLVAILKYASLGQSQKE